jgi:hypothetical protein
MGAPDLPELKRRAGAGEIEAMTELGKQLLVAAQPDVIEAIGYLDRAARLTGGEASAIMAVLCAAGAGTLQSWPNGFEYLRRSAQLGWAPARRQMLILAGDRALAEAAGDGEGLEPEDWKRLRQSIDLQAWLGSPPSRLLSESPRIAVIDGFAPAAMCEFLTDVSNDKRKRAQVYDPKTGEALTDKGRTNSSIDFNILESSFMLVLLRARIAAAARVPVAQLEAPSILHYAVGQQFTPHFDFLEPNDPAYAADLDWKGQRLGTFLVYLSDDFDGGETDFPLLKISYKGGKGDAIHFTNIEPSGGPDRRTLHAGRPPTRGEKWLFSQWIRAKSQSPRPFRAPR